MCAVVCRRVIDVIPERIRFVGHHVVLQDELTLDINDLLITQILGIERCGAVGTELRVVFIRPGTKNPGLRAGDVVEQVVSTARNEKN